MFMDLDVSHVRQRNEELMHEARKWHLQKRLRANREQSLGMRPQVDGSRTGTAVFETKQARETLMRFKLGRQRTARSMKTLALNLLGLRRNWYGSTLR
jgi:hypothetical protein